MRIVASLTAVAALWTTPAMAADWYLVTTTTSKSSAIFIDRSSLPDSGDIRRTTTLVVFAQDNKGAAAMQAVIDFDCKASRYTFVSIVRLDAAGNSLGEDAGSGRWWAVDPNTAAESELQFACTSGAQPSDTISFGSALPIARARERLATEKPGTYGGH